MDSADRSSPLNDPDVGPILRRHIEAGEISERDIKLFNQEFRWQVYGMLIGGTPSYFGTFAYLSRQRPVPGLFRRLLISTVMSSVGSFIGFAAGGVAGARAVYAEMEDPPTKMRIFGQIIREGQEAKLKRYDPRLRRTTQSGDPAGTAPAAFPPEDLGSATERGGEKTKEVMAQTKSTWDRLRTGSAPSSGADNVQSGTDETVERSKEQAEFDALLERERRGVDSGDKDVWG